MTDAGYGPDDLHAPGMAPPVTPGPGIGGRYKVRAEDFVVEEIPDLPASARDEGKYTVATVRTKGWEAHRLADVLASELGISEDAVHFSGTKDKRAVSTRTIAVPVPAARVEALDLDEVQVESTYRADRAPKIGELLGNRFTIVVRDVRDDADPILERTAEAIDDLGGVPNWFGPQRFGSVRPITHLVGEAIVAGDLQEGVRRYCGRPRDAESDDVRKARQLVDDDRFEDALDAFPRPFDHERRMVGHLVDRPGDWAGAIETMPRRLQRLLVYAYQSALFNRVIARRLDADVPIHRPVPGDLVCDADDGWPDTDRLFHVHDDNLRAATRRVRDGRAWVTGPLFATRTPIARGRPGDIERTVREEEGIEPSDFVVPSIPHLTTSGTRRSLIAPVRDLAWEVDGDVAEVAFRLPKGCYATSVLREIMCPTPEASA